MNLRAIVTGRKRQASTWLFLAALLCGLLIAQAHQRVLAQSPVPSDDQVNQIAHQLYCPVCENTPLDVCPTEACRQWRDLIRQQLSEGWSESRIKQYFVDQYGARVLAEPPPTGLNWVVYVLPPVIILAGAFLLFRAFRSWTHPASAPHMDTAATNGGEQTDEYVARVEEELKNRK